MCRGAAGKRISGAHRGAELRKRFTPGYDTDQQRVGLHRITDQAKRDRKVVHRVQCPDGDHQIIRLARRLPSIFDNDFALSHGREQWAGVANVDMTDDDPKALGPRRIGAADHQGALEPAVLKLDPFETVGKCALEQK